MLYANAKEAYSASALPPIGRSDHNLVFLQPTYKPCALRQPVTTHTFWRWTPEARETLQACYECTDWEVLQDTEGNRGDTDTDRKVDCFTSYLTFCRDAVAPVRTVRCFPNNKPWITCDIKKLLNQKKAAFRDGDQGKRKQVQQELKRSLNRAKQDYKKKVEKKLQLNNSRDAWRGMRTITGYKQNNSLATAGDLDRANEFNLFYNRFDSASTWVCPAPAATATPISSPSPAAAFPPSPSSHHCSFITTTAPPLSPASPPSFTVEEVRAELKRLHPGKAAGPDDVCPRLLQVCADQLAEPLQRLFNSSLQTERVPVPWKTSCLVPAPKAGRPAELNNYRPVALTSHTMKTLERLRHLRPQAQHAHDPP